MAPKSTILASSAPPSRSTYSCVRCSDRKVRCDRQTPCSTCVKHNVQCIFRVPPPPRRKQKRAKDESLKTKLKRYEALLQKLGVDPNELSNTSEDEHCHTAHGSRVVIADDTVSLRTPASSSTWLKRFINTSQLLHGQERTKMVDNSLWSRVVEEFHYPEEALEDSSDEASDVSESDDELGFVLSIASKPNYRYSHPPIESIHQLWQIFVENVDPLAKVVHVPSLQPAIQKAATDMDKVPRPFEALMFAIYATAVMSLKDNECQRRLGESRETLLSRYISGTKAALSRSKFMGTISIVVLQALVLHVFFSPKHIWTAHRMDFDGSCHPHSGRNGPPS